MSTYLESLEDRAAAAAKDLNGRAGRGVRAARDAAEELGRAARERIGPAGERARELASRARHRASDVGHDAVGYVQRRPLPTGLVVAGAAVGLFLLLNGRTRTLALAAAGALWDRYRDRMPI